MLEGESAVEVTPKNITSILTLPLRNSSLRRNGTYYQSKRVYPSAATDWTETIATDASGKPELFRRVQSFLFHETQFK